MQPTTASGSTRSRFALIVGALTLLGLALRIAFQNGRAFSGDEIGTLEYMQKSYGFVLTHFEERLTMNYYVVLMKALSSLFGDGSWVLAAPNILLGTLCIPLMVAITLRVRANAPDAHALGIIVGFLVAVNPCLVDFSVRIRSYMMMVAFSLATILLFYRWSSSRSWLNGIACACAAALALLAHPNSAYPLMFAAVVFLLNLRTRRDGALTLVVPMSVAAALILVAYWNLREPMGIFREKWTDTVPTDWSYMPEMARIFFVGGWKMLLTLALLGIGARAAIRENAGLATLGLAVVVPIVMTSLMGVSHYPWTYARFLLPVLPILLVFVAVGIRHAARGSKVGALVLCVLLAASWSSRYENLFAKKINRSYEPVAEFLLTSGVANSEVLCLDPASQNQLTPYLESAFFTSVADYLQVEPHSGEKRLFVVVESEIDAPAGAERFGAITVLPYTGKSRRKLLSDLTEDLSAGFDGVKIGGGLTSQYETILELLLALGRTDELPRFTALYYESLMRTRRQRNVPQQLLRRTTLKRHETIDSILERNR